MWISLPTTNNNSNLLPAISARISFFFLWYSHQDRSLFQQDPKSTAPTPVPSSLLQVALEHIDRRWKGTFEWEEWANSGWADRWLSLPDGSGLPHTHNLVDDFLTSLGDRKCLRGSEYQVACSWVHWNLLWIPSLCDPITADLESANPLWWSANKKKSDVGPADFQRSRWEMMVSDSARLHSRIDLCSAEQQIEQMEKAVRWPDVPNYLQGGSRCAHVHRWLTWPWRQ